MGDTPHDERPPADRLASVDLVRGIVMVLMVLDHVRNFFSDHLGAQIDPTDLSRASPGLFLTRWMTHFCAPAFVFLAGVGASLAGDRGLTRPQLAWFLLTRGLWLVVLEFSLGRLGFFFDLDYHLLLGLVLWALGWSMVILAALVFFPRWVAAVFALALIAGHNALDGVGPEPFGRLGWFWNVLHHLPQEPPFGVELGGGYELITPYKIIPWAGVMAGGYALGPVFGWSRPFRRRTLAVLGVTLTGAFVALRWPNWEVQLPWGVWRSDPRLWEHQADGRLAALSFINCTKYPPSLLFLLMTLGPSLIALAAFDRPPGPMGRQLITFGRVPLFFYLLHAPVIHALALAFSWAFDGSVLPWLTAPPQYAQAPPGYGYNLGVVYAVWAAVVLVMYPPCAWFAEVKRRNRGAWLSYL